MATDFAISAEDRPGELAKVGEALGAAGINIEGVAGFAHEGRGVIHVCVRDGAAARAALEGAGVTIGTESEAILTEPIRGSSEAGTLGAMARRIADAGINLQVLYVATGDRGVVVTTDNARAAELMKG